VRLNDAYIKIIQLKKLKNSIMKKIFYLTAILFLGVSISLQAQDPNTPAPAPTGDEPEIKFEKTVHDYGNIMKGDNGSCEFKFTNIGKTNLILTNVRSSCGCTVSQWPREPIAPGESSAITVRYNTQRVGVISKSVTVESNAINNQVVLRIKGNVANPPAPAVPVNDENPVVTPN
jgi:hypothetical protein